MTSTEIILVRNGPCRVGAVALLDPVDYEWASRHRWFVTWDRHRRKMYATRNTRKGGKQIKIYLHKEVLRRSGRKRRSRHHVIGDHKNGESMDCRRDNLRWATHSMNCKNRKKK